jgi:hypothetical protein
MKYRSVVLVAAVVAASLVLNSLTWWLQYAVLGLVSIGLYTVWTLPTLPDDAPRAPRTIVQ